MVSKEGLSICVISGEANKVEYCPHMSLSPIPKTAPFAEEEIELLNRVVGTATATQRAWLAGFLAGLEASTTAPQPASPAAAEPLTIVYATESGNSEKLAGDVGKAAGKKGLRYTLI